MCLWNGDKSIIEKMAQAYGVNVDFEVVATSIDKFWIWLEEKYGKPIKIERELPFTFTNEIGQIVNGEIDLVYQTENGDVLVDYKTYQGGVTNLTDESSDFYVGKYGGQITQYEEALKKTGRTIRDRLICYISLGVVFRLY
jgi:ATP-dependent exoDNAse (exonuclease V) beta subunit